MKHKYIIGTVCFVVIAALLVAGANFVLKPKWSNEFRSGSNIRGWYDMPEDSVDFLILGPSHVVCGVNPNLLYEDYGVSAYCCGTEAQPMMGSYYWLKESIRIQPIKAVVLDMIDLFVEPNDVNYRKSFDYMKLSSVKREALRSYKAENPDMSMLSYLLPLIQYHDRWKELTMEDFTGDQSECWRGFLLQTKQRNMDFAGYEPEDADGVAEPLEANLYWFRQIAELCRSEGIQLIVMFTPDLEYTAERHAAVQALADEYAIPFLDFNIVSRYPDIDYAAGMSDFRHVNSFGSAQLTPYVAETLLSLCELPDRRGDPALDAIDARWQAAWASALEEMENPTPAGER